MANVSKINFSDTTYDLHDARADDLLLSTLIIDTAAFIGGTWSVTGGDESYSGDITGDTVEVGLRAHDTTYTVTVTLGSDEWLTTVETGAYFERYVIDGFEQVWRA
ncbi:MAG: hypothetical protein LUD72_12630 [Bacteroidales bacterium]|nr:hypothetical protein [Bacteroidales bacterium]